MTSLPFIVIDGKCHRWKDIVALRKAQLAALESARATQLALFETLHDDYRPASTRTASDRYLQPGLFEYGVNRHENSLPITEFMLAEEY